MPRFLRRLFGIDNVESRPTTHRDVLNMLRTLLHRVEVHDDELEHLRDRMNSMRARITNVQRRAAIDDDDDDDEQTQFEDMLEERRSSRG